MRESNKLASIFPDHSAGDNAELQDLLPRFGGAALQFSNFHQKYSYLLLLLLVFLFQWIQNELC